MILTSTKSWLKTKSNVSLFMNSQFHPRPRLWEWILTAWPIIFSFLLVYNPEFKIAFVNKNMHKSDLVFLSATLHYFKVMFLPLSPHFYLERHFPPVYPPKRICRFPLWYIALETITNCSIPSKWWIIWGSKFFCNFCNSWLLSSKLKCHQ